MDLTTMLRKLRRSIASFAVVAIIASLSVASAVSAFSDVKESDWYFTNVQDLVDAGVLDGTKDMFHPADNLNRAEAAKIAVLAAGVAEEDLVNPETPSFSDVPKSLWAYKYIETAKSLGYVSGDAGKKTFRPGDNVNRAEYAKMMSLALELEENLVGGPHFSDVSSSAWYYNVVETAYNWSVVSGYEGGIYKPSAAINRAEMSKMTVAAMDPTARGEEPVVPPVSTVDCTKTPTDPSCTVTPPAPVAAGGLTVAASATPLLGGNLADGTAFNPLMKVKFSAGSDADVKVTKIKVTRGGIISDSNVKLSVWDSAGVRHGGVIQVSGDHNAEIGMEGDPIVVPKGTSVEVTISGNINAAANAGTLQLSVLSAADVTSTAVTSTGSFPIVGGSFNIIDGVSSVASATVDVRSLSSTARSVDIGQKDYELTRFEVVESSSKEDLSFKSIKLFNNGSTADGDVTNLVFKDQNGVVLATAPQTTNKYVTFTFATPVNVSLGNTKTFSVFADISNGATRTGQLILQNDFDINLSGVSTGATILATAKVGGTDTSFPIGDLTTGNAGFNQISINEGSASVSKDNASPSGDVTKGATEAVLGTFKLQALGEDIELQRASIDLANGADRTAASNATGYMDCTTTVCDLIGSVKLVTDDGKTLLTQTASTAALWNNVPAYADLSSYYTVKAGKTVTLKIVGSLSSASTLGTGETITAGLRSLYYYKKSSLKYADSTTSGVSGTTVAANQLTVTTSSLTVSNNSAYGNQTVVDGTSNVRIGSFVIKAGSAEGVNLTGVTLKVDESVVASGNANITNLRLMKVGATGTETQIGSTQSSVVDNTNTSFSISGLTLAASEQAVVNVYADLGSALSTHTLTTTIAAAGVTGSATQSSTSVSGPTVALAIQVITGTTGGALNVTTASDTPLAQIFVAGSQGNDSLKMKLSASLAEDLYVKEVSVRVDDNLDDVAIASATLYNTTVSPAVDLGTVAWQTDDTNPGYATWTFTGATRPKVASNASAYLTAKLNLVSSQQDSTVTGKTPILKLASVKAEGINQVTPYYVATGTAATDSTGNLPSDDTGGAGTVNDTGCDINDAANITAAATSITIDNGGAGTCNTSLVAYNVAYTIPAGTVVKIENEQMLVSASTATTLTVTRAVNATTAATHANNTVIYYGRPTADVTNTVFAVYNPADASFTTAATNIASGRVVQVGLEDMYVLGTAITGNTVNAGLVYVQRAVNNTTVGCSAFSGTCTATVAPAAAAPVNIWTAVTANDTLVMKTKPTISAASDSPSGGTSAGSNKILAKFNVSADLNSADAAENSVNLSNLDVRFSRTGVNLANLTLYPSAVDQNVTYAVTPSFWVSANVARFDVSGWAALAGTYSKVVEGNSAGFVVRGDVTATAQGGTLSVEFNNLGSSTSTASLGAGDAGGDVQWTDGTSTSYWVKQGSSTQVSLNPATLTFSAASGTLDTTRPVISTVLLSNGTGGGNTLNSIDSAIVCTSTSTVPTLLCDHATIVFSEAMDPTTINASLVPAGTVTGSGATTTITSPVAIQLASITSILNGTTGGGVLTFTNIMTDTATIAAAAVDAGNQAPWIALSADGTTLKIYDIDVATVNAIGATSGSAAVGTVLKDLNGNFLNTTAPATFTAAQRF